MFTFRTAVRFSDTDAMGHVNHARFLSYLEDARVAFFHEIADESGDLSHHGLIMAHADIDYVKPVFLHPDPLVVTLWVERIGGRSFTLGYEIAQDGAVVARAKTVTVGYDYRAGASRILADHERKALAGWQRPA